MRPLMNLSFCLAALTALDWAQEASGLLGRLVE
jgi:hypothetical protein